MHVPRDAKRDKINTLHSAHCGVLGMGLTPRHSGEKALGWTKCDTKRTPVLGDREVMIVIRHSHWSGAIGTFFKLT